MTVGFNPRHLLSQALRQLPKPCRHRAIRIAVRVAGGAGTTWSSESTQSLVCGSRATLVGRMLPPPSVFRVPQPPRSHSPPVLAVIARGMFFPDPLCIVHMTGQSLVQNPLRAVVRNVRKGSPCGQAWGAGLSGAGKTPARGHSGTAVDRSRAPSSGFISHSRKMDLPMDRARGRPHKSCSPPAFDPKLRSSTQHAVQRHFGAVLIVLPDSFQHVMLAYATRYSLKSTELVVARLYGVGGSELEISPRRDNIVGTVAQYGGRECWDEPCCNLPRTAQYIPNLPFKITESADTGHWERLNRSCTYRTYVRCLMYGHPRVPRSGYLRCPRCLAQCCKSPRDESVCGPQPGSTDLGREDKQKRRRSQWVVRTYGLQIPVLT
ncbi:hypothetical protein L209DRAFT_135594 [Thermothelomyces heterothallicus CBS 203.75]